MGDLKVIKLVQQKARDTRMSKQIEVWQWFPIAKPLLYLSGDRISGGNACEQSHNELTALLAFACKQFNRRKSRQILRIYSLSLYLVHIHSTATKLWPQNWFCTHGKPEELSKSFQNWEGMAFWSLYSFASVQLGRGFEFALSTSFASCKDNFSEILHCHCTTTNRPFPAPIQWYIAIKNSIYSNVRNDECYVCRVDVCVY